MAGPIRSVPSVFLVWAAFLVALLVAACIVGNDHAGKEKARNLAVAFVEDLRKVDALSVLSTLSAIEAESSDGGWTVVDGHDGTLISKGATTMFAPSWSVQDLPSSLMGLRRIDAVEVVAAGADGMPVVFVHKGIGEPWKDDVCFDVLQVILQDRSMGEMKVRPGGDDSEAGWRRVNPEMKKSETRELCGSKAFAESRGIYFQLVSKSERMAEIHDMLQAILVHPSQ
jgi:hypothetical protein